MPAFYDELAPYYHLIFADWDASMRRQGDALSSVIAPRWGAAARLLDVSCGIGTQSIPLAAHGYRVTASDLSAGAVDRASKEAARCGVDIGFSVCDMRDAFEHHGGGFDVVLACDNSITHLQSDGEIVQAMASMHRCLRPGGGLLLTVRDYDREPRGRGIVKPVRSATREGRHVVVTQVWDFDDDGAHYDLTMHVTEETATAGPVTHTMKSRYYAIGVSRLLALLSATGFADATRVDGVFYQPVLLATRPAD